MVGNVQVHPNVRHITVVRNTPAVSMAIMVIKGANEFHAEDVASSTGPLYNSEVVEEKVLKPPLLRARLPERRSAESCRPD